MLLLLFVNAKNDVECVEEVTPKIWSPQGSYKTKGVLIWTTKTYPARLKKGATGKVFPQAPARLKVVFWKNETR